MATYPDLNKDDKPLTLNEYRYLALLLLELLKNEMDSKTHERYKAYVEVFWNDAATLENAINAMERNTLT